MHYTTGATRPWNRHAPVLTFQNFLLYFCIELWNTFALYLLNSFSHFTAALWALLVRASAPAYTQLFLFVSLHVKNISVPFAGLTGTICIISSRRSLHRFTFFYVLPI